MGFEATNDSLIFRLDVRGETWFKNFNRDVLKVVRDNVARKVVLKKENLSPQPKISVPFLDPFLIEVRCHPSFCVVSVMKPQLLTHFFVKSPWPCWFSDYKRWKLLGSICIGCECVCQPNLFALHPWLFAIWQASIRCHSVCQWHQQRGKDQHKVRCVPIEKPHFIHVKDVAQLIPILLDKSLDPFPFVFNCFGTWWSSFPMSFNILQSIPCLEACQPTITELQFITFRNSHQVRKHAPFLTKHLPGKQRLVIHRFRDPKIHHLGNFWVLCLSNLFGTLVRCFAGLCPLCAPFSFMFKPGWDKQLLESKIRVEWIKVLCCCTVVLAMFMMPIENLDSLLQSCILFLFNNQKSWAAGWRGLGTSFACFSCSEPSEGNVGYAFCNTKSCTHVSVCSPQPTSNPLPIPLAFSWLPSHLHQASQAPFHSLMLSQGCSKCAPHQQCSLQNPTTIHQLKKCFLGMTTSRLVHPFEFDGV